MCTGVTPLSINSMKALTSLAAAAAFAIPLAMSPSANAAAEYCMTNTDNNRVCIHAVYGPRNNRGITSSTNGYMNNFRVNCYSRNYGSTSLIAYACWSYTGITTEPPEVNEEATQETIAVFGASGFVSDDQAVDLEKVRNAMPPEMK